MTAAYRRVLLKLSGEALEAGEASIAPAVLARIADEVTASRRAGAQIGIVVGGGNIFRGLTGVAAGMERTAADGMGMLATVMNCVALREAFVRAGQPAVVLSAIPVGPLCEPFSRREAVARLEAGEVVLLAGGTGNPYFTTDTAAALRALELGAEALLKATKVDGIYDKDPARHADAVRFAEISYAEVLARQLKVMDLTAVALCRDNSLPLVVFSMIEEGNIGRAIAGELVGSRVVEGS